MGAGQQHHRAAVIPVPGYQAAAIQGHAGGHHLWPEFASQIAALAALGGQRRPAAPDRSRSAGD